MTKRKIRVYFVYPPIPVRWFDWRAVTDSYEPGDPIRYGETRAKAVEDLVEQLKEREQERYL